MQTENSTSFFVQSTGAKLGRSLIVSFGSPARQENAGGVRQGLSPVLSRANWQHCGKFLPRQRGSCRMSSLSFTLIYHFTGLALPLQHLRSPEVTCLFTWVYKCKSDHKRKHKSMFSNSNHPGQVLHELLALWLVNLV